MYNIAYSNRSQKDAKRIEQAGLTEKVSRLIKIIKNNPFQNPPPYENCSVMKTDIPVE